MRGLSKAVLLSSGLMIASNAEVLGEVEILDPLPIDFIEPTPEDFIHPMACSEGKPLDACFKNSLGECVGALSLYQREAYEAYCKAEVAEAERTAIYDNCIISKSKGLDAAAVISVRRVCKEISNAPSAWRRWWWGN